MIEGKIELSKDSYIKTSIPYDKGFEIYIDGKLVDYEIVNKSFLGFKISKGVHNIKIVYTAPLFKEGLVISLFGLLLFGGTVIYYRKK